MNTLIGNITNIETSENLSLVKVAVGSTIFTSIVIDTPETLSYLKVGNSVKVYFKETEVIISADKHLNISLQNKIACKIITIKYGQLLSELQLAFDNQTISSIITTNACNTLNLIENDTILALIKTNEISLSPND